jgi:hypothetical protein
MEKRIGKYKSFVNESIFSRTFNERIERIDKDLIAARDAIGYINTYYQIQIKDYKKIDKYYTNLDFLILDISRDLNDIIKKFGANFTDDQSRIFVKKLNTLIIIFKRCSFNLTSTTVKQTIVPALAYLNSTINIINLLQKDFEKNIEYESDKDGRTEIYKFIISGGDATFHEIEKRSIIEAKEKEVREKHKDVDPYGEEAWGDEIKNETVKWWESGKLNKEKDENSWGEEVPFTQDHMELKGIGGIRGAAIATDFKVGDKVITNGTINYNNRDIKLKDREGIIIRIREKNFGATQIVVKFEGERNLMSTVLSPHEDCWSFFIGEHYPQNRTDGYLECYAQLFIKKL